MKNKLLFFGLLLLSANIHSLTLTQGESLLIANKQGNNLVFEEWIVGNCTPTKTSSYAPHVSLAKHALTIVGALYTLSAIKQLTEQEEIDPNLPQEAFIKATLNRKKLEDRVWKGIGTTFLAGIMGSIIELCLPPTHSLDLATLKLTYSKTVTVPVS